MRPFKLLQIAPETRRNALLFFTKPLPRRQATSAFSADEPQNQPDKYQYDSQGRQNFSGRNLRQQTPALAQRMEVRHD